MTSRLSNTPVAARPEPGQILLVIHNFQARSSDELSLIKGDRVELVERDDEFGDGWYLGKHFTNGSTGLFPEVYTKPAPRGPPTYPTAAIIPKSAPIATPPSPTVPVVPNPDVRISVPTIEIEKTTQATRHVSASQVLDTNNSSPLISTESFPNTNANDAPSSAGAAARSLSMSSANAPQDHGQDNTVMNETLSVIQEHISDMNTPRHSTAVDRRGTNDSGSDYSSHIDHRMSYINGEETDEEEDMRYRSEVEAWNPGQVADYLSSVGVETKHCEVFREQEITGDVLLGMDQTSVFLKEFELGSVGKRLKTWQKIKSLQDEVNGKSSVGTPTLRTTQNYGSDGGSDDKKRRSRSNTSGTVLPRMTSMIGSSPGLEASAAYESARQSQQLSPQPDAAMIPSPIVPNNSIPGTGRRPSAASVRDLHHSRQNSTTAINTLSPTLRDSKSIGIADFAKTTLSDVSHKKQPSFDRNWTMGSQPGLATRPGSAVRPLSSAGTKSFSPLMEAENIGGTGLTSPSDFDRGYFSGGEADGRQRNVLRKRGSASHSRNSSYTDEQRLRSATTNARHSKFGSVDSFRDSQISPASQKYYGLSLGSRRTPSVDTLSTRPMPPPKDASSPTVTALDSIFKNSVDSPKSLAAHRSSGWFSSGATAIGSRASEPRTISDSTAGNEKSSIASPVSGSFSPTTIDSFNAPSHTASSTTSGGPSFELDSNSAKSPSAATSAMTTPASKTSRKKSKKETSAYTQGLEKKTPKEQMIGCDYSGWMKKKSSNLLTTWRPRLFILKGRRLSYYYSEDDQEEKGLIDISFHRVLPADNDRLTSLHATLTGATSSPTSPQNSHTPTMSSTDAASEAQSTLSKPATEQMFIFKLVPPQPGFSRVNFTKPTVHYFAVPSVAIGRLWMAALMKATIDRDDSQPITTTYQQKTISLSKAQAQRHRPPALMNLDENLAEESLKSPGNHMSGLNINGVMLDREPNEHDSGVSGISKLENGSSQNVLREIDSANPETG